MRICSARSQSKNALVIPLSEHVDYWNYIGWSDPFSSPAFSDRQRGYGRAFRLDSIYTPQMVVNGKTEFVGSDRDRAADAIAQAASGAHADVQVKSVSASGAADKLEGRVENVPAIGAARRRRPRWRSPKTACTPA